MKEAFLKSRNRILKLNPYSTFRSIGPDHLVGKSGGEFFSLECDAGLMKTILSYLDSRPSIEDLRKHLKMPLRSLKPLLSELIEAGIAEIAEDVAYNNGSSSYIDSILIMGNDFIATELLRTLNLVEIALPVYQMDGRSGVPAAIRQVNNSPSPKGQALH